jgi:hypothetical protein
MTMNVETDERPQAQQQTDTMRQLVTRIVKQYAHDTNNTAIRLLVKKNGHTYKTAAGLADQIPERVLERAGTP